jgi:large subunit ribosomal protein L10
VDRARKKELVASFNRTFADAGVIVVTHYQGLTVAEMTQLRGRMAQAGASLKVAKNRLVKLALEGTRGAAIKGLFKGPTAIAYSGDPVAAPKVVVEFARSHDKLVVLGGAFGDTTLDAAAVKALAELPSLDQLRAKLVGLIAAPATRIAGVLQAPGGGLARVMQAFADKGKAAA